jgi:hypothetical protein
MLCEAGEELRQKYAWAIPDARALRIIKHFAPVVEMGAGTGYWCYLLRQNGIDIVAYDLFGGAPEQVCLPSTCCSLCILQTACMSIGV